MYQLNDGTQKTRRIRQSRGKIMLEVDSLEFSTVTSTGPVDRDVETARLLVSQTSTLGQYVLSTSESMRYLRVCNCECQEYSPGCKIELCCLRSLPPSIIPMDLEPSMNEGKLMAPGSSLACVDILLRCRYFRGAHTRLKPLGEPRDSRDRVVRRCQQLSIK